MVGQENGQTQETGMTSVHSQPGHRARVLLPEHCLGSCEVTGSLAFSSPTGLKAWLASGFVKDPLSIAGKTQNSPSTKPCVEKHGEAVSRGL